jgi:hypothetical protein
MGYIGAQRSTNSKIAIEHYEVPLSMITKNMIREYLDSDECQDHGFTPEQIETLRSMPVSTWKYAAKKFGCTSWHHTGSYYQRTNHYDLACVAEHMLDDAETIQTCMERDRRLRKEETAGKKTQKTRYGWCKYEIWEGTRNHPHMAGYGTAVGIVVNDDWIKEADGTRHKLSARKTVDRKYFATFDDAEAYDKKKG